MRLKRWESPRREGRNNKGKGGSARQRQLKKKQQMLRRKLTEDNINGKYKKSDSRKQDNTKNQTKRGRKFIFPFFFVYFQTKKCVMRNHTNREIKV